MRTVAPILGVFVLFFAYQAIASEAITSEVISTKTTGLEINLQDKQRVVEAVYLDEAALNAVFFQTNEHSITLINSTEYAIRYQDLDLPEINVQAGDILKFPCSINSVNTEFKLLSVDDETHLSQRAMCGDIVHVQTVEDQR